MAATVIETYGVIRADGTLELDEKLAGPRGRVKVRVETVESVAESAQELAARFAKLVAEWKEGTRHRSRIKDFKEHAAFREIVATGERAVPLILDHLEKDGDFLFLALGEITRVNPVPKECAGKIDEMIAAWIAWGREQGHRCERAV